MGFMLEKLFVLHYTQDQMAPGEVHGALFFLKTCQRTLVVGYQGTQGNFLHSQYPDGECFWGTEAYEFLLEVLCGLRSRVLAESEVAHQFKQAYQQYLRSPLKTPSLSKVLEKLFKDAKEIRTLHLRGVGQKTYGAITRKVLFGHLKLKENASEHRAPILILGTGELAKDMIHQLQKRARVLVSGRNQEKLASLSRAHQITPLPWTSIDRYSEFPAVVNTIGTEECLFDERFFHPWTQVHGPERVFVDLGSPSPLATSLNTDHGVYRLEDIFERGVELDEEKLRKVSLAQVAVKELAHKRNHYFSFGRTIPSPLDHLEETLLAQYLTH